MAILVRAEIESRSASSARPLWAAHMVSLSGRWMHAFALGWVIYQLTHSSLWLSAIAALGAAPLLPLGLFGGAIADRFDKARVLVATQALAMGLALVTAVLVGSGAAAPWSLAAVSLAYGLVSAIDAPTLHAYLFEAGGERTTAQIVSLQSLMFNSTRIAAPAIAALFISRFGESLCFFANAVSFLPLLAVLTCGPRLTTRARKGSLYAAVRGSLGLLRARPRLMRTVVQVVVLNLFAVPCLALLPALAVDVTGLGLVSLGLMTSGLGLGALLAAGGLHVAPAVVSSPTLRAPGAVALCVSLAGLVVASAVPAQVAWSVLAGAALTLTLAHANYEVQAEADKDLRGRLTAWYLVALLGTAPVGHVVIGLLSACWGVPPTVQGAAVVCVVSIGGAEWLFASSRNVAVAHGFNTSTP